MGRKPSDVAEPAWAVWCEDAAALHLHREFVGQGLGTLTYDPAQGSADFILQIVNQKEVVIEISIGDKWPLQVKNTMQKIKSNYGIIVSNNELKKIDGEEIIQIPLQYFLMMWWKFKKIGISEKMPIIGNRQ